MAQRKIAAVGLALCLMLGAPLISAAAAGETMTTLFPDEAFRKVVIDTFLAEGVDLQSLTEQNLLDALGNFEGNIIAKGKGIKVAQGLQYLVRAESVNLDQNEIEDWYFLGLDDSTQAGKEHYKGWQRDDVYNVRWILGSNPFRVLPSSFGGQLVIEQPATTHSNYIENFRPRVYLRNTTGDNFAGWFDVTRCIVKDVKDQTERFVKLDSIRTINDPTTNPPKPSILNVGSYDSNYVRAPYSNVKKSGTQWISVGVDAELHYQTSDGFTIGPGSQSFKYYLHPQFFIYDRVTIQVMADVTLSKVDRDTRAALSGAKYNLYNADTGAKLGEYTTGANGQLRVERLAPGNYELVETQAPAGYALDGAKQSFSVGATPGVTLGGGLTAVQTTVDDSQSGNTRPVINSDGPPKIAGINEVLIAGADGPLGRAGETEYVEHASPDITMTPIGVPDNVTVTVLYSALDDTANPAPRRFSSLSAAAADVNAEKNKNNIIGPVRIGVPPLGVSTIQLLHENTKIPTPTPIPTPPTAPHTGDNAPLTLEFILALTAMAGLMLLLVRKRVRR